MVNNVAAFTAFPCYYDYLNISLSDFRKIIPGKYAVISSRITRVEMIYGRFGKDLTFFWQKLWISSKKAVLTGVFRTFPVWNGLS